MKKYSLSGYITEYHGGNVTDFARTVGSTRTQVSRWLEYGDCSVELVLGQSIRLYRENSLLSIVENVPQDDRRLINLIDRWNCGKLLLNESDELIKLLIVEREA